MTTPYQLAAQLGNLQLRVEDQKTIPSHILNFKYPAVELLPTGVSPTFEEPVDISKRQPPSEFGCQVKTLGTKFFTFIEVDPKGEQYDIVNVAFGDYKRLVKAVDDLKLFPGESSLGIVVYNSAPYLQRVTVLSYRFRLTTNRPDNSSSHQDFELSKDQFSCLYAFVEEKVWIDVLFDLVRLESERAFLEFQKVITEEYGNEFRVNVTSRWAWSWMGFPPRDLEQIFYSRLLPASGDDHLAWNSDRDAMVRAILPCGDEIDVQRSWVESFKGEACWHQKCRTCGCRIMGPSKMHQEELERNRMFHLIRQNREEAESWLALEALPPMEQVELFNSATLFDALEIALESFRMAEPVCHPALCPLNWDETEIIQRAFEDSYGDKSKAVLFHCSAEGLCGELTVLAGEAVAEEGFTNLTPGLEAFVNAWMLRTINLLSHRVCKKKGKEHAGLHQHQNQWSNNRLHASSHETTGADEGFNHFEDMMADVQRNFDFATMKDADEESVEEEEILRKKFDEDMTFREE